MAEIKPYERYKKDKSESKDELEIFKKDFYESLQGVGEPKARCKMVKTYKRIF